MIVILTVTLAIQEEDKKGGKKGRLLGIITLSDVLRYLIGETNLGDSSDRLASSRSGPVPATEEERTPQPETIVEGS